jgi:hypothetical protein
MGHHVEVCLVSLVLGLICFGLAGLSYWVGEALVTPRHVWGITREDYPFWFWFFVVLYVIVGLLFVYGGVDGLIHDQVQ